MSVSGSPDGRGAVTGIALYDKILLNAECHHPWGGEGTSRFFRPDLDLLSRIIEVPVRAGASTQTGLLGKGLDAWFAHEFRRAGFDPDSVWPRAEAPRVLPQDVTRLLAALPRAQAEELRARLGRLRSVAPQDASVRGRAYVKQVDVVMSSWQTGPELLLSTKSQSSSFGKNLPNRFEEAYGDAGNLRARYPLAAIGFAFVVRSTILDEPVQHDKAIDMMLKLRDRGDSNGYTSTCLLIAHWEDGPGAAVTILPDAVPAELGAGPFLTRMIETILDNAPASEHVKVRDLHRTGTPRGALI